MRAPMAMLIFAALVGEARPAAATYSPPLTRVRIDADRVTHTPELVLAFDRRDEATFRADAQVVGLQYILQIEREAGFGVQLGAAIGQASVALTVASGLSPAGPEPSALFAGAQARFYAMLWSHPYAGRAHALTGFVNLRFAHYSTLSDQEAFQISNTTISAGVGAMAELVLGEYVSVCPYAWLSPGLYSHYAVSELLTGIRGGPARFERDAGPGFRTPLQLGLDVWIYVRGAQSDQHLSLSVIASMIDTSDQSSRALAGVIGWTF